MRFHHLFSRLVLLLALFLIAGISRAESDESMAEYERYAEAQRAKAIAAIPRLVKVYGEAIGCNFAMDKSNVAPYAAADSRGFVALFSIDEGCSGGSAMSRPVLAMLRWGGSGMWNLYIDPNYSLPIHSASFPQTVTRIYAAGAELRFEALELRPLDPLCCPSRRVSGQVVWISNRWAPR